jgi:hypothetical protein
MGEATLWDAETGVEAFRVRGPRDFDAQPGTALTGFCFSRDGACLGVADAHSRLFVWEAAIDLDKRRAASRTAAAGRALEWHQARREVCKLYQFAEAFHQKQIGRLLCPE